jgi:hypothetical protein
MKTRISFLAFIIASITSCTSVPKDIDESEGITYESDSLKNTSSMEYDIFKDDSEEKISNNEKMIADLKLQMTPSSEKEISKLEERNSELKKRLSEYREEDYEKLETFSNLFNEDLNALTEELISLTDTSTANWNEQK